ncbi:hypothetical protein WJX79_001602 [Trebouxia sp. C0005]
MRTPNRRRTAPCSSFVDRIVEAGRSAAALQYAFQGQSINHNAYTRIFVHAVLSVRLRPHGWRTGARQSHKISGTTRLTWSTMFSATPQKQASEYRLKISRSNLCPGKAT